MNSDAKLIKTKDGSDTIFLPQLNEHYHSIHGALQESQHVYIKSGLDYFVEQNPEAKEVHVFEVGMGTGLNVLLTIYWALEKGVKVYFTTIEPHPLDWELLKDYNFGLMKEEPNFNAYLSEIHQISMDESIGLHEFFDFKKMKIGLEDIGKQLDKSSFDVVYFDAFAPNKQEEMWSAGNFKNIFTVLKQRGLLVTYCAQGKVRRTMQEVGFEVQRIEGPPGKREMLRAIKP